MDACCLLTWEIVLVFDLFFLIYFKMSVPYSVYAVMICSLTL